MLKSKLELSGKRVLVAEDNLENQELMRDMFEYMNCKIDIAENGEEALKKYKQNSYDLIILDVQMPQKDGYEVSREIRKLERDTKKHIPILALTANALSADREKCIQAGMNDYLSKPVDIESLEKKLVEILY